MCEFCSGESNSASRDVHHSDFAGFFSAEAIDAAVRQANALHANEEDADPDDDTDGT